MKSIHKFFYGFLGLLVSFVLLFSGSESVFAKKNKRSSKNSTFAERKKDKKKPKDKSSKKDPATEDKVEEQLEMNSERFICLYGTPEMMNKRKAENDTVK